MKKNNKGFSLVELIVVIAIMAILAAVAIPTFAGFIEKANEGSDDSFLNDVKYAVELALTEEGGLGNSTIEVNVTSGVVVSIEVGEEAIYDATDAEDVEDEYGLADVVDFSYAFKAKDAKGKTGSFAPDPAKAGTWKFTPATP